MEGLITTSNSFGAALEGYLSACSAVGNSSTIISQPLLNLLADELLRVSSYVTKLAHAKATLGRLRNHAFTLTPINSLPDEVLGRIFDLVVSTESCNGKEITKLDNISNRGSFNDLPKYPDLLSQVCSRWRQIMIASHHLWTHIDLVLHHRFSKSLLTRAEMRANRAGHSPLDIHIIEKASSSSLAEDLKDQTLQCLASVPMRMRSLELVVRQPLQDFHTLILQTCFSNAVPGNLTKLKLLGDWPGYQGDTFLEAAENAETSGNISLNLPQQFLEELWRPITVLQLYGLYPPWSSQAYHGLVELHLSPRSTHTQMSKSQLVGILTSSPELRVLHLVIQITESPSETAWVALVRLEKLETLNILELSEADLGVLLSLLAPGSKPLQLAIGFPDRNSELSLQTVMKEFFARSNINKLYVERSDAHFWLPNVQVYARNLRVLVIEDLDEKASDPAKPYSSGNSTNNEPSVIHLNSLYITTSHIQLRNLRYMLETYSVHTLTLWKCTVYHDGGAIYDEEIRKDLSGICPIVELLGQDDTDPLEDWELFDQTMFKDD